MTESEFVDAALSNPVNARIMERISALGPALGLDDCWLVSGCLFQTVWNTIDNQPPERGIRDYDLFYFDPDTSWEAEDAAIKRTADIFSGLDAKIELRNQARVHLWFEKKFGAPYPPLTQSTDGIDRFLMHNAMVGIRPNGTKYDIYAPHGFVDIAGMIVRPNRIAPNFQATNYLEKAQRWKVLWPALKILPPDD